MSRLKDRIARQNDRCSQAPSIIVEVDISFHPFNSIPFHHRRIPSQLTSSRRLHSIGNELKRNR